LDIIKGLHSSDERVEVKGTGVATYGGAVPGMSRRAAALPDRRFATRPQIALGKPGELCPDNRPGSDIGWLWVRLREIWN